MLSVNRYPLIVNRGVSVGLGHVDEPRRRDDAKALRNSAWNLHSSLLHILYLIQSSNVSFASNKLCFQKADDFPDFVIPLARSVASGDSERGIAICGSGVGASIAANKVQGVRAALIVDAFSAHQGVEDDDMNLICLGGRVIGSKLAEELIIDFLKAKFIGGERHIRRLDKVKNVEKKGG